jgi:hypothetical protein
MKVLPGHLRNFERHVYYLNRRRDSCSVGERLQVLELGPEIHITKIEAWERVHYAASLDQIERFDS